MNNFIIQQKQTDAIDLMSAIAMLAERAKIVGHINSPYQLRNQIMNIQKLAKIALGMIGEVINAEQLKSDLEEQGVEK